MRVVLADRDADVRGALRLLLIHELGMEVVAEAVDADDLWLAAQDAQPDLLLVEWEVLGPEADRALARLHALSPRPQVIAVSGHPEACRHAVTAGADAFVCKADPPEQVVQTLRAFQARGETAPYDGATS
jgi:two-component system response regulator DesR